jgi:hypothetical protein
MTAIGSLPTISIKVKPLFTTIAPMTIIAYLKDSESWARQATCR